MKRSRRLVLALLVVAGATVALASRASATELVTNGGFESGLAQWSRSGDDGDCSAGGSTSQSESTGAPVGYGAHGGATALFASYNPAGGNSYGFNKYHANCSATGVTVGQTVIVSGWVLKPLNTQQSYGDRTGCVWMQGHTDSFVCAALKFSNVGVNIWTQWSITYPAPYAGILVVRLYDGGQSGSWFDDVSVSTTSGPTTTTAATGGGGTTCVTAASGACKVDVSTDSGGFLSGLTSAVGGIGGAVGSVLSSPLAAIKDAVTSLGGVIVDGFSSLLLPSSSTQAGLSGMWTTAQTRFPFSVFTELVSLPANAIGAMQQGLAGGPPSDCSAMLCGPDGAVAKVGTFAPLTALRDMCGFVLLAAFGYGVLRSVGEAVK